MTGQDKLIENGREGLLSSMVTEAAATTWNGYHSNDSAKSTAIVEINRQLDMIAVSLNIIDDCMKDLSK